MKKTPNKKAGCDIASTPCRPSSVFSGCTAAVTSLLAAAILIAPAASAAGTGPSFETEIEFRSTKPTINSNTVVTPPPEPPEVRSLYFEFDESDVRPQDYSIIESHARYLEKHKVSVVIEAHADEVGSKEYNLRLALRRGQSVEAALVSYGAPSDQIDIHVSGEDEPDIVGHVESAYDANRRVLLKYGE